MPLRVWICIDIIIKMSIIIIEQMKGNTLAGNATIYGITRKKDTIRNDTERYETGG